MASKRRLRRKSCDGKQRFDTAAEAKAAILRLKTKTGTGGWFNPYRCTFCHGYHFGHAPGSRKLPGVHASR